MRRQFALLLSAIVVASTAWAQNPPIGIPRTILTVWIDDSGNASSTTRTWSDADHDGLPQCVILSPSANGECGAASNGLVPPWSNPNLPVLDFRIGPDPGPGGLSSALIYSLPSGADSASSVTQSDLLVNTGSGPATLIRFNGDGSIILYAGVLPTATYGNTLAVDRSAPWRQHPDLTVKLRNRYGQSSV
jgi:hypothetical protein